MAALTIVYVFRTGIIYWERYKDLRACTPNIKRYLASTHIDEAFASFSLPAPARQARDTFRMSDMKHDIEHVDDQNHIKRSLTTVTLTPEQFESLYLQPRDARMTGTLASRVGNPTPL